MIDVIDIFRDGLRNTKRVPPGRATPERLQERLRFIERHRELYILAQAVGQRHCQREQVILDRYRREVMRYISQLKACTELAGPIIHPVRVSIKNIQWCDYVMTPEFHQDPTLTGIVLPSALVFSLNKAHKEQVKAILHVVGL